MSAATAPTSDSEKRAARRRALKQIGLIVVGAFSFWGVFGGLVVAGTLGAHHGAWILFGIVVTLACLALMVWSFVAVVRMIRADYRRRKERAQPLVELIEERNRQAEEMERNGLVPAQPTTFLRITPLRWLVAELIPFGFLAVGVLSGTAWHSVAAPFVIVGFLFCCPLSFVYLYKVHGAPSGWILPLIAVYLPSFVVCSMALGEWRTRTGRAVGIHITSAWLIAHRGDGQARLDCLHRWVGRPPRDAHSRR